MLSSLEIYPCSEWSRESGISGKPWLTYHVAGNYAEHYGAAFLVMDEKREAQDMEI